MNTVYACVCKIQLTVYLMYHQVGCTMTKRSIILRTSGPKKPNFKVGIDSCVSKLMKELLPLNMSYPEP